MRLKTNMQEYQSSSTMKISGLEAGVRYQRGKGTVISADDYQFDIFPKKLYMRHNHRKNVFTIYFYRDSGGNFINDIYCPFWRVDFAPHIKLEVK